MTNEEKILATLEQHTAILEQHSATLGQIITVLNEHTAILNEHTATLRQHTAVLEQHSEALAQLLGSMEKMGRRMDRVETAVAGLKRNQYETQIEVTELRKEVNGIWEDIGRQGTRLKEQEEGQAKLTRALLGWNV